MSAVEVAIAIAVVGSLLAVAVPVFLREMHASRLTEAVNGLGRLATASVAYAEGHRAASPSVAGDPFPPASPLTPEVPPRGAPQADPPGTWDGPTWKVLGFEPASPNAPHSFAFAYDRPTPTTFVARAHGDLDGDGTTSSFRVSGAALDGTPRVDPGMVVEAELE